MKTSQRSFLFYLFLILSFQLNAQVIPDSLRTDWSHSGYSGTIPSPALIINVKDFGAYGDSIHDDYNAIMSAINTSSNLRVIFFPAGNYLIKSTILLPSNIILRGEGSATNLQFDLSSYGAAKDCIKATKDQNKSFTPINNGYLKNSTSLTISSTSGFIKNGYAEIIENNGDWDADKSTNYVGQIVKITKISGKNLSFSPALRLDFIDSLQPRIRSISPIENVGIECVKITRKDTAVNNNYGCNMSFMYANNCWVTGVESNECQVAHLNLSSCSHITVSGCYFHDAYNYGGGGQGYGVYIHKHTSDCKTENSIFTRLRHSMLVIDGPNGNVFGYNYSFDTRSTTEVPPDAIGDIALHGHYAFANLYEGNIVQNIFADDFWGASGPYNTIFRNRAELYGIVIFDQYNYPVKTNRQNIVGNEVTNTDSLKGYYFLAGSNHFTYGNNVRDTIQPQGTTILNDSSYYLNTKPYFWNIVSAWPSIGIPNAINTGSNPAKERYLSNSIKTSCEKEQSTFSIVTTADSIICNGSTTIINITASGGITPYKYSIDGINFQSQNSFTKNAGTYTTTVVDANADTAYTTINFSQPAVIKASLKKMNLTCNGDSSGTITITASGGTNPYQYKLNAGIYQSNNVFRNLKAGSYNILIKDAGNCILSIPPTSITQPSAIIISNANTNVSCKNGMDGSITVTASKGVSPYKYSLNDAAYQNSNVFSSLKAGTYKIKVQDINGCTVIKSSIKITQSGKACALTAVAETEKFNKKNFTVNAFPNPSKNAFDLEITGNNKEPVQIKVTDIYGREMYRKTGAINETYNFGALFTAGIYIVEVIQNKNIKVLKVIKQ